MEEITTEVAGDEKKEEVEGQTETEQANNEELNSEVNAEEALPKEPRKKTAQERIDELTKKRREAEREAEYWKEKALRNSGVEQKESQLEEKGKRPNVRDFETVEDYENALFKWHDDIKEHKSSSAEKMRKHKEMVDSFNSKADAIRAEHDDYDDIINAPIFTPTMKDILFASDNGPELAYYLGLNRNIADKIAKLPVNLQIYELGKLETQYMLQKKQRKSSSAPAPISPLGATGETTKIDESKLSDDEWYKLEKKRRIDKLNKRGD